MALRTPALALLAAAALVLPTAAATAAEPPISLLASVELAASYAAGALVAAGDGPAALALLEQIGAPPWCGAVSRGCTRLPGAQTSARRRGMLVLAR